jgi:hypothetical protein
MTQSTHKAASTDAPLTKVSPAGASACAGTVPPDDSIDEMVAKRRREAALRANSEAAARRAEADARQRLVQAPIETAGRGGPDPVRYGDWEVKGIATDF